MVSVCSRRLVFGLPSVEGYLHRGVGSLVLLVVVVGSVESGIGGVCLSRFEVERSITDEKELP